MLPERRRMMVNRTVSKTGLRLATLAILLTPLASCSAFVSPSSTCPRIIKNTETGILQQQQQQRQQQQAQFKSSTHRSLCKLKMKPRITMVRDFELNWFGRNQSNTVVIYVGPLLPHLAHSRSRFLSLHFRYRALLFLCRLYLYI